MGPLPSEREIQARLRAWGLSPEEREAPPAASKNRTLLCRKGPRKVLVKISDGPANVGVVREGAILELLSPLSEEKRFPLIVPRLLAFDRALGLLAVEWLSPSETLHSYHRRTRRYGAALARQLGRAVAFLHRESHERPHAFAVRDGFSQDSDLLECFLRMRPDFYARLSRAGIAFFSEVQSDTEATAALQGLSDLQESGEGACLLHGDLKQANLLRVPKGGGCALALVDWELSIWGDPARDLGSLLADYALGWLAPEHRSEAITQRQLQALAREVLLAYRKERRHRLGGDFSQRLVRWTAVALLFYVYGMTHYEGEFSERAKSLTRYAVHMLASPERWPAKLWGSR
ncbi:MAG: phosphotransferase [Myxococcales bacterium]|nr:phosphotransferase [Myxococcales bacterium]